jgi:hypothetical protein
MIKTMPDQVTRIITPEATGIVTMREIFKIQTYAVSIRKTAKALCRTAGRGKCNKFIQNQFVIFKFCFFEHRRNVQYL